MSNESSDEAPKASVRAKSQSAALRANDVLDADGHRKTELAAYCPTCDKWNPITGRRRTRRAGAVLRSQQEKQSNGWEVRNTPISEVMSHRVFCVRPDMSAEDLTTAFLERGIGGAPVVDDEGRLCGIVSKSDLLRAGWEPDSWARSPRSHRDDGHHDTHDDLEDGFHLVKLPRATVGEIMTPFPLAMPPDATIGRAAALMAYEGIDSLIVVAHDGSVIGIVSGSDLLRWIAVHAGFIVPEYTQRARTTMLEAKRGQETSSSQRKESVRFDTSKARARNLVMIVEDDAELRGDLAELLEEQGYRVITAANGREALDRLGDAPIPSLILLDLQMPVMNGWSFHAELLKRTDYDDVPVVLLSGADDLLGEVDRLRTKGFLSKPVPFHRLLGTVQQFCG